MRKRRAALLRIWVNVAEEELQHRPQIRLRFQEVQRSCTRRTDASFPSDAAGGRMKLPGENRTKETVLLTAAAGAEIDPSEE